jgi:signal peptidase I
MKSNPLRPLFLVLGSLAALLFAVWVAGRSTGALQFYSVPSNGNAPSIPAGSLVLVNGMAELKCGDMVCFLHKAPGEPSEIWIKRLRALEGDTVELHGGQLRVNRVDVDSALDLQHSYALPTFRFHQLIREKRIVQEDGIPTANPDTMLIHIPDRMAREIEGCERMPMLMEVAEIRGRYGQPWSPDEFGPYVVPPGHCFLLGDNRNASRDSRFIGPVSLEAVRGVVFLHW